MFSPLLIACGCMCPEAVLPATSAVIGAIGLVLAFANPLRRLWDELARALQRQYPWLFE